MASNGHIFLTDIASYKPYYLLYDDLEKLRIFYGNFSDYCYLAPEKFLP
jgi:hypothetical protein